MGADNVLPDLQASILCEDVRQEVERSSDARRSDQHSADSWHFRSAY